jgi:hypothetical protein
MPEHGGPSSLMPEYGPVHSSMVWTFARVWTYSSSNSSSSDFHFSIDGKRLAMSRIVNVEDSVLQRLLDAGVDFHAAPSNIPWLSLIWSAAYAFFIWKISSRLLQGPQDEGVGKGRDKINLKPYGALSFDDSKLDTSHHRHLAFHHFPL